MTENIRAILEQFIPVIPEDINYWLVRANSGKYFDDFLLDGFVGVNTYSIPLSEFQNIPDIEIPTQKTFLDIILDYVDDVPERNLSYTATRTYSFMEGIKENDIILTPGKKSTHFLLGVVGELFEEEDPLDFKLSGYKKIAICPYNIRRKVHWIKIVKATEMDDKLLKLKNSQHTIINLTKYQKYIDPLIFSFYFKGEKFHASYKVGTPKDITVDVWKKFQDSLAGNLEELSSQTVLKQNVQSIGSIFLSIPWDHAFDLLKTVTPFAAGILTSIGFSKNEIKSGEHSVSGLIPTIFLGKTLKEQLLNENTLKNLEKQKIQTEIDFQSLKNEQQALENQLLKEQLQNITEGRSSVSVEVPEMQITSRNVGNVVLFQRPNSDPQIPDEE